MAEMFDLTGKVAIVTGGHSGIGKAIAEGLVEAGANIVICARRFELCEETSSEIAEKFGLKSLPIRCDVTSTTEVNNLVETTIREFEKVDILINAAGVGGSEKPVVEMSDEDWDTTLNINLKGAFLCSRAVSKVMMQRKEGKIVNISSMLAFIALPNMSAYSASKGGLIQLTRVMALELVRHNIQVNAVCPGYFLTPMNKMFFSTKAGKRLIEQSIPMRRLGRVDELKGIALYFASPASSYATGTFIIIDGGYTLS